MSNYKSKTIEIKYLNTWCYWLINYIPELLKIMGGFKDKVVTVFKTNTHAQTVYGRERKLSKRKSQKQSEENIFKNNRNLFYIKRRK